MFYQFRKKGGNPYSWTLGILYVFIFSIIGIKANSIIAGLYIELSKEIPKVTYFVLNCHWSLFIAIGIVTAFFLVYKDIVYSQRVVIFLNYVAAAIIVIILFIYGGIVLMPLFDFFSF